MLEECYRMLSTDLQKKSFSSNIISRKRTQVDIILRSLMNIFKCTKMNKYVSNLKIQKFQVLTLNDIEFFSEKNGNYDYINFQIMIYLPGFQNQKSLKLTFSELIF